MKKVAVSTLYAGLRFTEPVYIEGNSLLAPAGAPIKERDIERLISWGIESVQTEGEAVDLAGEDGELECSGGEEGMPGGFSCDLKGPIPNVLALAGGLDRGYQELIEKLDAVFTAINAGGGMALEAVTAITDELLQAVREQRDKLLCHILGGGVSGRILAKNSVNAAVLSALIAGELKLPEAAVRRLVTGALLHDTGMLRLPQHILDKRGGLTESELQRIQSHSLHSYTIIVKELLYPEEVGLIGLQHHERWDGEGYPGRIAAAGISLGARIVSVADAFEAMVSEKPYRTSLIGYQAMKNLLSDNSRGFDPAILKVFIQIMGLYPIGSIILLDNGAIAQVMETQSGAPLRPKIRIFIDELGNAYAPNKGALIDLAQERGLFIARALDPKEVKQRG
ncbi:MAG: HD-GYP domain-containing protein [Treponema sp.]|jgi:HD-GYP domain-containing protein (c-di-GMP phosphodiesterase class II)|nr:HD-GYP domain-containing protein [Treponema sp.]